MQWHSVIWLNNASPYLVADIKPCATCTPNTFMRRNPASSIVAKFLFILVIAAGCYINLRSIRAFPNFSATDEAIIFDYTDTWKRVGSVEPSMSPYRTPIVNGNLYIYAAALWTSWFPNSPFTLRNLSALGGFVLLVAVYAVTRQLGDRLTAAIAVALMATNLLWMAVSHIGRQDVWLAVFVWTAVGLLLAAQKRNSRGLTLLAGVVAALSADVHPLGVLACIALGMWWLCAARKHLISRRMLFSFIFGGVLGTVYYFATHIALDPAAFVQAVHNELYSNGAEGGTPLGAMIQRHLNYLASNPLEIVLLLVCSVKTARQQQTRGISTFALALVLLYAFLVADPNPYYPIVWFTGLVILSAIALRSINPRWRVILILAFFASFIINASRIERHIGADWNARALSAIQQVAAQVPENGIGLGENFLYIALRNHPEPSSRFIGFTYVYFRTLERGASYWDEIQLLHPAWLVTMRDESAFTPSFDTLSVPVPHMRLVIPTRSLERAYILSDSIPTSVGTFEIWQRH